MNCNDAREYLALRLYDELDEVQDQTLESHLAGCSGCRSFETELDRGLGRLSGGGVDDLPAGWEAELRARTNPGSERRAERPWVTGILAAAGGLAAGYLLALARPSFQFQDGTRRAPIEVAGVHSTDRSATLFRRTTAPPMALASGELERLRAYLGR